MTLTIVAAVLFLAHVALWIGLPNSRAGSMTVERPAEAGAMDLAFEQAAS